MSTFNFRKSIFHPFFCDCTDNSLCAVAEALRQRRDKKAREIYSQHRKVALKLPGYEGYTIWPLRGKLATLLLLGLLMLPLASLAYETSRDKDARDANKQWSEDQKYTKYRAEQREARSNQPESSAFTTVVTFLVVVVGGCFLVRAVLKS